MNYKEIIEKLKESEVSLNDFAYEDYDSEALGLGPSEEIEQEGGEGQGDHWHSVKYFKDHDVYIMVTGFYSSYDGTDFYGGLEKCCSEVRPQQKTITVYESL